MIQSSHLHEPSVVKVPDRLVSQASLPSLLTIPRCLRVVGYARPLETGFRSNGSHPQLQRTVLCTEGSRADKLSLVIMKATHKAKTHGG
jgi:hypothetical protein